MKKCVLVLLTAGSVCFLVGLLQVKGNGYDTISAATTNPINNASSGTQIMLVVSIMMVGVGCYLGSLNTKRKNHSFTLDFKDKKALL